jgi:hypothetical protein
MTTTVTLTRQSICSGGEHIVIRAALTTPSFTKDYSIEVDEALKPLAQLSDDERKALLLGLVQLHCRGMTKTQANAELVAGVILVI